MIFLEHRLCSHHHLHPYNHHYMPPVITHVINICAGIIPHWHHPCCVPAHHKLQFYCSPTRDQCNHGNSLNNKGRPRPGQQRRGILLRVIRLHKWLVPKHKTFSLPLKWVTSLHPSSGTPPSPLPRSRHCTLLHHLSVVKYPHSRGWAWVVLQTSYNVCRDHFWLPCMLWIPSWRPNGHLLRLNKTDENFWWGKVGLSVPQTVWKLEANKKYISFTKNVLINLIHKTFN